jgi:formylglycine-generating enzyme required for sulfatase activity
MCSVLEDGTIGMKSGRSWRNPNFSQTGAHPVVCVSWMDANAYALWLSRKTGKNYRLLTEAEWEYAARAGTASRYFFGDDGKLFCKYGNGVDPTTKRAIVNIAAGMKVLSPLSCNDGNAFTAPVGSFLPNGFGLYDMHGNAYQWLQDCINNTYEGAPFDGSAWLSGDCSRRITRGGAWSATLDELRVAARSGDRLEIRQSHYGFRVGRALIQ